MAKLVLSAIEPQLRTQQSEISKLATAVQSKAKPAPARAVARTAGRASEEERRFERQMGRFLRRGRGATKTSNLHMADYRLSNDIAHGEHGKPPAPPPSPPPSPAAFRRLDEPRPFSLPS